MACGPRAAMRELHGVKPKTPNMDQLNILDPRDLRSLLAADPEILHGLILRLNRAPHYHNRLNAIVLLSSLQERRRPISRRTRTGK